MSRILRLACRSAWSRRGTLSWVVVSIALSTLLMLSLERIRTDVHTSFKQAVSGTDLIVGPRTGSIQLLLYSVFRIGAPTHNLRMESVEALAKHPGVAWVVPLSFGDSHHGFPVMGTEVGYFEHFKYGDKQPLLMTEGRPFAPQLEGLYEAVLGAEVAQAEGYRVDQEITLHHGLDSTHGLGAAHADKPFKVVGILARTGTPVDKTIHVNLESLSAIHLEWAGGAPLPGLHIQADHARKFDLSPGEVSAALVGLKNRAAVFAVQRHLTEAPHEALMAILPGVALDELWRLISVGEKALLAMSALVALVSMVGLVAVVLAGLNERRRELAVLRAIGASPRHIGLLLALEGAWITLLGLAMGSALTFTFAALVKPWAQTALGISLQPGSPTLTQVQVLAGVALAGLLASALPAWRAYRLSLSDGLSPPA